METDQNLGAAIENLYPALTECFVIIICGYFAGRMNWISETEAKGINTFVGTFSLPSLIFMSLAQLDLTSVNWTFLLSILLSKSIVFFSVIVITVSVGRPVNFGRAGIFAIFCTQSNDFAIGYPIVAALYKSTHPEYASYLYLMAPISLAILNPISFVLMEIEKRKSAIETSDGNGEKTKLFLAVTKSIFTNPIILMTLLGIVGNFAFDHAIPCYLGRVLEALGSAFSASALFLLGLRMVGKVHKLKGGALVVPGILIIVKLLVLPVVTREVVSLLRAGHNASETNDLSTYGFLYGTFPAAPTVFVFASQYAIDTDLIASAMVACTFISAPLMFVSAKMITLTKADPSAYVAQLNAFTFDVSVAASVVSVWVIFVFAVTKKINRIPHKLTACLVVSQLTSCLGAILWNALSTNRDNDGWPSRLQFALFTVGVYASRLWTACLAAGLLFLQCRSLCYVLKIVPLFYVIGWGVPIVMAAGLLFTDRMRRLPFDDKNPNFVYGLPQAIIAVSLLVLCFIVTVGCLILHQRYKKRAERYWTLANDVSNTFDQERSESLHTTEIDQPAAPSDYTNRLCSGQLPTINEGCCEDSPVADIEDLLLPATVTNGASPDETSGDGFCPSRFGCGGPKRNVCHGILQRYQEQQDDDVELIEEEPDSHDPQILRHLVLLILLLCSIFVGLALSIWTLVMEQMSGIYVELSFLDATLNFGQSIIVFGIFGTDTKEIVLPLLKYWRRLWYGANKLSLPSRDELGADTRHVCDQFVTHHLEKCKADIAEDKRWRIQIYRDCFTGHRFVDWLIEVGLARDRIEAVNYARHLIEGRTLMHINGVHHFYDRNLLYTFY